MSRPARERRIGYTTDLSEEFCGNAACTKYGRSLMHARHHDLHWLDVSDRITCQLYV